MSGIFTTTSTAFRRYHRDGSTLTVGAYGGPGRAGVLFTTGATVDSGGGAVFGSGIGPPPVGSIVDGVWLAFSAFDSPTGTGISADLDAALATIKLRVTSTPLATASDWDTTDPVSNITQGGQAITPPIAYPNVLDITRAWRVAVAALGGASPSGLELRTGTLGAWRISAFTLVSQWRLDTPIDPRAVFGGDTTTSTVISAASSGRVAMGEFVRDRTIMRPNPFVEIGGATKQGLIYQTSGRLLVGDKIDLRVLWRTNGRAAIGGKTTERNRFVVPLRLKAGMVDEDVGYMWIPVYLQLPDDGHVASRPWEFYYPTGQKIPHLIRNTVDHQVRALVYMRPKVAQSQDFYCRVG